ncbi:unnamed protein product [Lymnaea stagnalis]|uniref:Uncharacterized protein n=1 Tax=Lymnaea stagnalis TaxID=6523 RepID=A0AAV2I2S2_LYMST
MGNRIGGQKQKDQKNKGDKRREKEAKKEKEKLQKKEKRDKKKKPHPSGLDTDFDESSHVTGGDSESCVFHSAENVSSSPYLDACTRSELEHGTSWSGMCESFSSATQHSKVLSSKDFKDGFSLEACIPPDIARPETYDDGASSTTSRFEGRSGSSVKSRRSNNSVKSNSAQPRSRHDTPISHRSQHGDDAASVGTSSQVSGGYHTPLLSTPIFGRTERPNSPVSGASSTLTRVQETDPNDSMDITPKTTFHHPHFYNHQKPRTQKQLQHQPTSSTDFRNLPKPTSPHPQRRALSPKMTSAPVKLISSDESSSSPTTPTPQRRAANILDLFRPGSRSDKSKKNKNRDKQASTGAASKGGINTGSGEADGKSKSSPLWKTWERSSAKKIEKQNRVSIFGTTRKTEQKNPGKNAKESKQIQTGESIPVGVNNPHTVVSGENISITGSPETTATRLFTHKTSRTSSRSSDSNLESVSRVINGSDEGDFMKRTSSPPMVKSAAVCIMKLEELERSIEQTIREKFPDAEPFLLKKRTKDDEVKGSRSLPSTPSLKKKLYVVRDVDDSKRNSQKDPGDVNLNAVSERLGESTRLTFECLPSPAMSPVVLRRFGARTRHASISPKIPRAKTAALYASPGEMSRMEESMSTKTVTKVPVYHALSTKQPQTPVLSTQLMKPLSASQKSTSKYDNVMDDTDDALPFLQSGPQLVRQHGVEEYDSDEVDEKTSYDHVRDSNSNPVIVPTFSAVFGSVSPKLRRHVQMKVEKTDSTAGTNVKRQLNNPDTNVNEKTKAFVRALSQSPKPVTKDMLTKTNVVKVVGSAVPISVSLTVRSTPRDGHPEQLKHVPIKQKGISGNPPTSGVAGEAGISTQSNRSTEATTSSISPAHPGAVHQSVTSDRAATRESVKPRPSCLNKSLSKEWTPATAQEHTGSNTGRGVSTKLDATRKLSNDEIAPCSTDERNRLTRVACDTSAQLQQKQNHTGSKEEEPEKCCSPTSPGTQRKHSTEHVIFGSAVTLPCRLNVSAPLPAPASPGQEDLNNVNISQSASPRDALHGKKTSVLYVKKQKSISCEEDKRAEFEPQETSVAARTEPGDSVSVKRNVVSSVPISNTSSGNCNITTYHAGAVINKGQIWPPAKTNHHDQSVNDVTSYSSLRQIQSYRNVDDSGVQHHTDYAKRDTTRVSGDVTQLAAKSRLNDHRSDGEVRKDYRPNNREDEQRFVVLRNPVSKVISEMINVSKLEEQIERRQQLLQEDEKRQLQQPKIQQAGPEYGVKHVKQVVATVRTPSYELPCLTLEEKTVRSDSSVSLPSSPLNSSNDQVVRDLTGSNEEMAIESKCQEIQTDTVTTADKSVDSNSLTRNDSSKSSTNTALPLVRHATDKKTAGQVWPDVTNLVTRDSTDSSSGESEFLQMVLASKKSITPTQQIDPAGKPNVDDQTKRQAPPPPSPTAIQQLIEEFEEEGSDAEVHEKKEIEMALRKESEIKEFTDKIYKRLSNLLGSQEDIEDDVFAEDAEAGPRKHDVEDLFSRLDRGHDSFSSDSDEDEPGYNTAPMMSSGERNLSKVLTIETSSSLTTTTSSESDIYEEPPPFHAHDSETNANFLSSEGFPKRKTEPNVFVFPELENVRDVDSDDARQRRNSREYHSDDDVATGRGIPDYYDDKPLWTKRQKPPGHMSAAMMAIRRRERRERWLKKRRRNKTDLLSTGSSDTGSELALDRRDNPGRVTELSAFGYDEDEEFAEYERRIQRNEMGSGILTSPKYSKPILPFLGGGLRGKNGDELERESVSQKIESDTSLYRDSGNKPSVAVDSHRQRKHGRERRKKSSYDNDLCNQEEDFEISDQGDLDNVLNADPNGNNDKTRNPERFSSGSNLAIPGIEETFNELMSVKHILEGLQDRTPAHETNTEAKFMPLTTENVKSIREYYKDCYSSGNGRRSRMSATDRTESDLDIYSENRDDDESTDSNFNADDEEDDDGMEPYATADDDLAATGGSSSTGPSGRRGPGDDDDSETNVVVSCTFYNSNAFPAVAESQVVPKSAPIVVAMSSVKSTPNTLTPTAQASLLNSDEEFWAGSAAIDDSYRQLETATDAVSSTFQNAREQMQDIQHHLQALRRQMEVLQDDLTSTPKTVPQEVPLENQGK